MSLQISQAASQSKPYLSFSRAHNSIDALDGLRTIAIVLVLFRHAIRAVEDRIDSVFDFNGWSLATPMLNGWMGVDLFFVLSGFLIGGHLIRRRGHFSSKTLGSYFGSRALRIIPTYFCVLFLVAAGFFPFLKVASEDLSISLIWHMLFLQDYLSSDIIVAFWSLGVEEKFYIIAPFLVLGIGRLKSIKLRISALVVIGLIPMILRGIHLAYIDFDYSYLAYFETFRSPFHMTFEGLLMGVLCAEIYENLTLRTRLKEVQTIIFSIGTAIIVVHLLPFNLLAAITVYDVVFQPLILSIGFGMILLATALRNSKTGWLTSYFSLIGARLSYSLYLVHMAVIPAATVLTIFFEVKGLAFFATFCIIYLAMSVIMSLIIHFLIEKPFLQLKSRVY